MKIYDFNGRKNLCGSKVRKARKERKLSQSELAAQLQLNGVILERDSISRIEAGTRFVTDYELVMLAKVLKVDLNSLISLSDKS